MQAFILDSTDNEASLMDHVYDLDGCSAEVKSAIMQVLDGKKTGAFQYNPLTMLSLPQILGIF